MPTRKSTTNKDRFVTMVDSLAARVEALRSAQHRMTLAQVREEVAEIAEMTGRMNTLHGYVRIEDRTNKRIDEDLRLDEEKKKTAKVKKRKWS